MQSLPSNYLMVSAQGQGTIRNPVIKKNPQQSTYLPIEIKLLILSFTPESQLGKCSLLTHEFHEAVKLDGRLPLLQKIMTSILRQPKIEIQKWGDDIIGSFKESICTLNGRFVEKKDAEQVRKDIELNQTLSIEEAQFQIIPETKESLESKQLTEFKRSKNPLAKVVKIFVPTSTTTAILNTPVLDAYPSKVLTVTSYKLEIKKDKLNQQQAVLLTYVSSLLSSKNVKAFIKANT